MKRWLSILLLFGALLGLFGQGAAFALAMPNQTTQEADFSSGMSADCAKLMGQTKQQPEKPCQGLTLDCIAKMGCALPLAMLPPATSGISPEYRADMPVRLPVKRLVGHNLSPEPEPPAHLG